MEILNANSCYCPLFFDYCACVGCCYKFNPALILAIYLHLTFYMVFFWVYVWNFGYIFFMKCFDFMWCIYLQIFAFLWMKNFQTFMFSILWFDLLFYFIPLPILQLLYSIWNPFSVESTSFLPFFTKRIFLIGLDAHYIPWPCLNDTYLYISSSKVDAICIFNLFAEFVVSYGCIAYAGTDSFGSGQSSIKDLV